ncbi:MAG: hypothetical protein VR72_14020 [Clostridiaceae bacterium BRH_c20a]|nr:MAG: hypothetical protein VR72_14020 [Clostridiaceae bacterium BRH_c20a]
MNDDKLDKYIKNSLKLMIEGPAHIDGEKMWEDFSIRLKQQQELEKRKHKKQIQKKYLTAVAAILILTITTVSLFSPSKATAFKENIYQFFSLNNNETIIKKTVNPQISNSEFKDITFEKAQELTVFQLKHPGYLPPELNSKPEINVFIKDAPLTQVEMIFNQEDKYLSFVQKNNLVSKKGNIHIPKDTDVKRELINNVEIVLMQKDDSLSAFWDENSIDYTINSKNLDLEDIIQIIKNLQ